MLNRQIHHYRVESLLGEGGMGTVYQATDIHLERPVAVKMLHPHLVSQTSFMERFRNEAQILARLNHPNIAVVYNFLQDGADYFMAMEYVEGDTLETLLRKTGALPAPIAAEITRQGLEGMAHAHRKNILHRDIKPANLMLTPEGTIKLMDFGIARVIGNERLTQVNRIVGTLEYMAPELVRGEAPSPASDLYAMGMLLYELLSGKLPFASRTDYALMQAITQEKPTALRKQNALVPKELEAIVHKALEKNPAKRFADAKEFQRALQPFFSQAPTLDPALLIAQPLAKTTDVHNIQPIRQTVLADAGILTREAKPVRIPALPPWILERWQTLLAGILMALALLFIGLIVVDRADDERPAEITANQHEIALKKPVSNQKPEPVSEQQTAVLSVIENPAPPNNSPKPEPEETMPGPVEKRENAPVKQPKTNTPAEPKVTEPLQTNEPEKTTPPVRLAEPESEVVRPKSTTRRTISIRRLPVNLALIDGLSSESSREGQSVRFRVTESVMSGGDVVIQSGATAYGEVSRIRQAEGDVFRKKNLLEFRINTVEAANGKRITLRSATFSDEAKGQPVQFRSGQTFEVRTSDDVLTF